MTTTPFSLAILTSDAGLLRCQVDLVKSWLIVPKERPKTIGLGYVEADSILLRKKPGNVGSFDPSELVDDVCSDLLFFSTTEGEGGGFVDESVMPLRFRNWMFMQHGELGSPSATRETIGQENPSLLRQAKGTSASELCFHTFLSYLRDSGLGDEIELPAQRAGSDLGRMARHIEAIERRNGKVGSLSFFVTNGRIVAATRLSSGPLFYRLLEGVPRCARCGLAQTTSDLNPLLRAHRRVRAVILATAVGNTQGFIEVPEASVVTIGRDLQTKVSSI